MTGPDAGCGGHAGLSAELRVAALGALDRLEPVLERICSEPVTPGDPSCAACPLCAVLAALRGERPELAVRLAEHATGLVTVLRAALEESGGRMPRPAGPGPNGTGPAEAGHSEAGSPEAGHAEAGHSETGWAETGWAETGRTATGRATAGRIEPGPSGRRVHRIRVDRVPARS